VYTRWLVIIFQSSCHGITNRLFFPPSPLPVISCTNPHPLSLLPFLPSFLAAVSHAHGPSLSLPGMPSSRNGPLLPRAAATVAIKRQRQAADDGVPFSAALHNARVQLHRDEYADRSGLTERARFLVYYFHASTPRDGIGERKGKISRTSSELSCGTEEIPIRGEAPIESTIAPTMAIMLLVMLRRSIPPLRSSSDDSPIAVYHRQIPRLRPIVIRQ